MAPLPVTPEFPMDKEYWSNYYATHREVDKPSLFARYLVEDQRVCDGYSLIELGCGNGRDSTYFHRQGLEVTGVDQVQEQIDYLSRIYANTVGLNFRCADFTRLQGEETYGVVYSRFTLHSVSREQQLRVVGWAYEHLATGGLFCIEVRGKKNELFQRGARVPGDPDAYIHDGHYRRFLDYGRFLEQLEEVGFTIVYSAEQKGFAPFGNTDETFIRVIASK